jgi:hypothetical protein
MQKMPDIDAALDIVFQEFSKTESIKCCTKLPSFLAKKEFYCLWEMGAEVDVAGSCKSIELYIGFKETFPLSIPNIYLSDVLYQELQNAPHIDKNHFICTYHTERIIIDPNNPIEIVELCLDRAKQIIRAGLLKNNGDDFYDELTSYWTNCERNDEIEYLSLIKDYSNCPNKLILYALYRDYRFIKYILYVDREDSLTKSILEYLKSNGYTGKESEVLFLKDCEIKPYQPLPSTNGEILIFVPDRHKKLFEQYINQNPRCSRVFFVDSSVGSGRLLGWSHLPITTIQNGFRKDSLRPFDVLRRMQKGDKITRILVNQYSNDRIEQRTAGRISKKHSICICGLGSVGSNLLFFLNSLNYPEFKLIDNDMLTIDNIGRHLLGFSSINFPKSEALKQYLHDIRPDQTVSTRNQPIEAVIKTDVGFINDADYIFLAIGNQNIENYIFKLQAERTIIPPIFMLWVEPYALGGHCVYIHPDDMIDVNALYDDSTFYKYNIISNKEYRAINPVLSKQEAGCNTVYTPYSGNDIVSFLSAIFPYIRDVVQSGSTKSFALQWVGDLAQNQELGLRLKESAISFNINRFDINDENKDR